LIVYVGKVSLLHIIKIKTGIERKRRLQFSS
jgi:hypothetical protein